MGAAIQDAAIPAAGGAAGAGTAVAVGFSGGLVAVIAGLGAAIGSLLDQAGESQQLQALGLDQLAPFGLGALFSALFWPVLAIILALWFIPGPHQIVIKIWNLARRSRLNQGRKLPSDSGVVSEEPDEPTGRD